MTTATATVDTVVENDVENNVVGEKATNLNLDLFKFRVGQGIGMAIMLPIRFANFLWDVCESTINATKLTIGLIWGMIVTGLWMVFHRPVSVARGFIRAAAVTVVTINLATIIIYASVLLPLWMAIGFTIILSWMMMELYAMYFATSV